MTSPNDAANLGWYATDEGVLEHDALSAEWHYQIGLVIVCTHRPHHARAHAATLDEATRIAIETHIELEYAAHASERPDPPTARPGVAERAWRYVDRMDRSIAGQRGSAALFRVAAALTRGFALDLESAYQLLTRWNEGCSPPWRDRTLRRTLANAQRAERPAMGALVR